MEKTLYDTGILIEKYRKKIKSLSGYTTILNVIEFPKALKFKDLKIIYPDPEDYVLALNISKDLLKIGKPIPTVDIVIASIAIRRELKLETRDKHFTNILKAKYDLKIKII